MGIPIVISWSGGKDCFMVLERLLGDAAWDVRGLLTCITTQQQVSMHGVPRDIVSAQADRLGLPLLVIEVPPWPSNEVYEEHLGVACRSLQAEGIWHLAFGDLFLEEIRQYRVDVCQNLGMTPLFPLWGLSTRQLAQDFIAAGHQAIVCCVDPTRLSAEHVGRAYDSTFLDSLPEGVDPCGEQGEFHTLVIDSPLMARGLQVTTGDVVLRDGFCYCDLQQLHNRTSIGPTSIAPVLAN